LYVARKHVFLEMDTFGLHCIMLHIITYRYVVQTKERNC
jgi:hypothetical protein